MGVESIVVGIPWPPDDLWNNSSASRWAKARAKRVAKEAAYYAALASGIRTISRAASYTVSCAFTPPMRPGPARDMLNCHDALKPYFDGIALAMRVDDRIFRPGQDTFHPKAGAGHVLIEIRPVSGGAAS